MVCDQAFLERIIAACGRIVTPVEGVLTNEVLFQHATEWASALRAGLFPGKPPFTAPGRGMDKKNMNNKTDKKRNQWPNPMLHTWSTFPPRRPHTDPFREDVLLLRQPKNMYVF